MDGNNAYSAQIQVLVTGHSVGQISVSEKFPKGHSTYNIHLALVNLANILKMGCKYRANSPISPSSADRGACNTHL